MKFINNLILLVLLTLSNSAFAQTHDVPKAVEKDVFLEALNAIDTIPTRVRLLAIAPNAALRLEHRGCDLNTKAYPRNRAISLLSMFGEKGREALTRLTQCAIPETQERAIYTLARTFPENKKVTQLVLDFNHLDSKTSALWSIRALRWIAPEIAKPTLLKILKSDRIKAIKLARRILNK